jgi:adenylate cyclase class 2
MPLEVEQKFVVADRGDLERRLQALAPGATHAQHQVDSYFAHPSRDFARTDEALRLRSVGESNYITYKGPKLDTSTKTRREIELELPAGRDSAEQSSELLKALGFTPVAEVRKRRDQMSVVWQDREVEVAMDSVEGLGNFVELEILATEADLDAARSTLLSLAEHLQLVNVERRSYLELLLESHGGGSTNR